MELAVGIAFFASLFSGESAGDISLPFSYPAGKLCDPGAVRPKGNAVFCDGFFIVVCGGFAVYCLPWLRMHGGSDEICSGMEKKPPAFEGKASQGSGPFAGV